MGGSNTKKKTSGDCFTVHGGPRGKEYANVESISHEMKFRYKTKKNAWNAI
jgi:hypothetical protein